MATLIGPDLVPEAPSRVVTIDASVLTEDAPRDGSVTFTLEGDLRVPAGDKIIAASSVTVTLVDGKGQVRLPTVGSAVVDDCGDSWYIRVRKSWLSCDYPIRVPAGTGPISLADIGPARVLPPSTSWALSTASLTVTEGPAAGSVTLENGNLAFRLSVPRGIPGPGSAATDDAVAALVGTESKTQKAIDARYPREFYNPVSWGADPTGGKDSSGAWAAMLSAIPSDGIVRLRDDQRFKIAAPVTIGKPVTILGGLVDANPSGATFVVAADRVTLDRVRIAGPGTAGGVVDAQRFITTTGTASKPVDRLTITGCRMTGAQHSCMWLDYVTNARIEGNYLGGFQYAGLMLLSADGVDVTGNTVRQAVMASPLVNAYGLCATDLVNTAEGRSRNVRFISNHVEDVPWNGIDTHGGEAITCIGNVVRNCRSGIAMTVGNSNRVVAPSRIVVTGNTVLAGATEPWRGIILDGWDKTRADGIIQGNVVRGYPDKQALSLLYVDRVKSMCGGNSVPEREWTPLHLGNGWQASFKGYEPQYMLDGNTVRLRGMVQRTSGTDTTFARIPVDTSSVARGFEAFPSAVTPFASVQSTAGNSVQIRAVPSNGECVFSVVYPTPGWSGESQPSLVLSGSYSLN